MKTRRSMWSMGSKLRPKWRHWWVKLRFYEVRYSRSNKSSSSGEPSTDPMTGNSYLTDVPQSGRYPNLRVPPSVPITWECGSRDVKRLIKEAAAAQACPPTVSSHYFVSLHSPLLPTAGRKEVSIHRRTQRRRVSTEWGVENRRDVEERVECFQLKPVSISVYLFILIELYLTSS